ncbi:hypothetical protein MHU86_10325 [Fragilaria crotonensis]|nr:hypothetical protein MHU86_10325 [Fragilaria crotonensis]
MRESLEVRKEWRAFYAYHLERFRQLHAAVVLQYHDKLTEVDQRCRNTEEDLRVANRDLAQISQVTVDKTKEVVRLEKENKRVHRELNTFKHESAKLLLKIAKEHRLTKAKLESELEAASQEIDSLEGDIKKYEGLKKENRSSKRLNAVLNDKLRVKTKEATDLFAENLKLREQGMLLRRDLTNASQHITSLTQSLASDQEEKAALLDEVQTARNRSSLEQEDLLQVNHQLKLRVDEVETLLQTQNDELQQRYCDLELMKDEMSQLRAGKEFEREVNEGLCETLEGALREAYEQCKIKDEVLLDTRLCHELAKQELSLLTAEFELERECANNLITSLQEQLYEADVVGKMQESDLDESQRILFAFSDEAAALKSDLELEGRLSREIQESITLQLQDAVARNEVQDAQIMESQSRNDILEAERARQHAEIEALQGQAAQLRKDLDSQREQSSVLVNRHTEEVQKLQDANTSLLGQLAAIKSASEGERDASVEEIESLKIEIGGLQMDNQLLEYEISQLKAHLEIVMEENVLLSDNAFEAGDFGAREQSEIDFGMIIASFDMDDEMAIVSPCTADAAPLSHMMRFASLSQGAIDDNILAAFGELDQALRSNDALLDQVSKAGLTPKREPRASRISIAVDELRLKESSVSRHLPRIHCCRQDQRNTQKRLH